MILYTDPYDPLKQIHQWDDYIEVQGGDGTLLTAINKFRHLNLPFFGIAGGTRNFLMNSSGQLSPYHSTLSFPLLTVQTTSNATVYHSDGTNSVRSIIQAYHAFNDVVLGQFNTWCEFNCKHRDNQLGTFKGSGMIVSTAAGSTGINRNNHGTVLPLNSPNWSVTGMQTDRVINSVLTPDRLFISLSSRSPISVAIDGSNHIVDNVLSVTITKGPSVELIFNDINEFQIKRR